MGKGKDNTKMAKWIFYRELLNMQKCSIKQNKLWKCTEWLAIWFWYAFGNFSTVSVLFLVLNPLNITNCMNIVQLCMCTRMCHIPLKSKWQRWLDTSLISIRISVDSIPKVIALILHLFFRMVNQIYMLQSLRCIPYSHETIFGTVTLHSNSHKHYHSNALCVHYVSVYIISYQ